MGRLITNNWLYTKINRSIDLDQKSLNASSVTPSNKK